MESFCRAHRSAGKRKPALETESAKSRDHHRGAKKNLGDPGHRSESRKTAKGATDASRRHLECDVGKKSACEAMAVSRATFYRHIDAEPKPVDKRPHSALGLKPSRTASRARRTAQRALPGYGPFGGLCQLARRGPLSVFASHDVPDPIRRARWGQRAPSAMFNGPTTASRSF